MLKKKESKMLFLNLLIFFSLTQLAYCFLMAFNVKNFGFLFLSIFLSLFSYLSFLLFHYPYAINQDKGEPRTVFLFPKRFFVHSIFVGEFPFLVLDL